MSEAIYCRAATLMEADIGDELVALDSDAGLCFGFNAAATSVWRALSEPQTFNQLRDMLLAEFAVEPEQCEPELAELLDDMIGKSLIVKDAG